MVFYSNTQGNAIQGQIISQAQDRKNVNLDRYSMDVICTKVLGLMKNQAYSALELRSNMIYLALLGDL